MPSTDRQHYCPFLNRADERCSSSFRLDHLGDAFGRCFDRYRTCDVYHELLLERQVRRAEALAMHVAQPGSQADGSPCGWPASPVSTSAVPHEQPAAPLALVQVTIAQGVIAQGLLAHRDPLSAAGDAGVPAAPGR